MKKLFEFLLLPLFLTLFVASVSAQEFGVASYYSDEYHGGKTAYGDTYDKNKLTAAHKLHPYGTLLRVTRLDNKKSVTVKVTDKGPFIKGRIVDLSRKAAEKIGLTTAGVAEVKVEIISKMDKESTSTAKTATASKNTPKSYDTKVTPKKVDKKAATKVTKVSTKEQDSKKDGAKKPNLVGKDFTEFGLYKITLLRPGSRGYGVQVAAISNYQNVFKQVAKLQAKWFEDILINVEKGAFETVYKIILGPYNTEDAAKSYQKSLKKRHKIDGYVVSFSEDLYKITLEDSGSKDYGVQVVAMTDFPNTLKKIADLQEKWFKDVLISIEKTDMESPMFKIILGPFTSEEAAKKYKKSLKSKHKMDSFTVNLSDIIY